MPSMCIGDWCVGSDYQTGMALAHNPNYATIYAANDQMAYDAMLGLQPMDKRMPKDVGIAGVDDPLIDTIPRLNPTITKLHFGDIDATALSMVRH